MNKNQHSFTLAQVFGLKSFLLVQNFKIAFKNKRALYESFAFKRYLGYLIQLVLLDSRVKL